MKRDALTTRFKRGKVDISIHLNAILNKFFFYFTLSFCLFVFYYSLVFMRNFRHYFTFGVCVFFTTATAVTIYFYFSFALFYAPLLFVDRLFWLYIFVYIHTWFVNVYCALYVFRIHLQLFLLQVKLFHTFGKSVRVYICISLILTLISIRLWLYIAGTKNGKQLS